MGLKERKWVFASNTNFLIPISLQPDEVKIFLAAITWSSIELMFEKTKVYDIELQRYSCLVKLCDKGTISSKVFNVKKIAHFSLFFRRFWTKNSAWFQCFCFKGPLRKTQYFSQNVINSQKILESLKIS